MPSDEANQINRISAPYPENMGSWLMSLGKITKIAGNLQKFADSEEMAL